MGGTEPVWDPGGTVLYYVETDGDRQRLVKASLRTSPSLSVDSRETLFSDLRHGRSRQPRDVLHPPER